MNELEKILNTSDDQPTLERPLGLVEMFLKIADR
jgi:hypothetical protein